MTHRPPRSLLLLAAFAAAALSASPARAATFTVTTLVDSTEVDLQCSIREALMNANANATVRGDCPADGVLGDDVILLPAGTIHLLGAGDDNNDTGDLDIAPGTGSVTLRGAGRGATILDAGLRDRVLHAESQDQATTHTIEGVTFRHGGAGALRLRTAVVLLDVAVEYSESFGEDPILMLGAADVEDSSFAFNRALRSPIVNIDRMGALRRVSLAYNRVYTSSTAPLYETSVFYLKWGRLENVSVIGNQSRQLFAV